MYLYTSKTARSALANLGDMNKLCSCSIGIEKVHAYTRLKSYTLRLVNFTFSAILESCTNLEKFESGLAQTVSVGLYDHSRNYPLSQCTLGPASLTELRWKDGPQRIPPQKTLTWHTANFVKLDHYLDMGNGVVGAMFQMSRSLAFKDQNDGHSD